MGGSYHMEKAGLVRAVQFLQSRELSVETLVTDRHKVIAKWVRTTLPGTTHCYDVWHVAKGESV